MSAELITAALLNVAGVTNLVGDRRALAVLPQNCAMPALVYSAVSTTPIFTMNALSGPFTALLNSAGGAGTANEASTIAIQDSLA